MNNASERPQRTGLSKIPIIPKTMPVSVARLSSIDIVPALIFFRSRRAIIHAGMPRISPARMMLRIPKKSIVLPLPCSTVE